MITAIAWSTPHHRLRRSLSSRRSLLVDGFAQLSLIAAQNSRTQLCPRGTPMQSAQGWRSQTKGESRKRTEESLLSSGRFRLSPATGAHNTAAFQFKSTFLSRRTQVLCFFLDSRKKRNPSSPLAPSFFPPISKKICVSGWKRRPFAL